MFLSEQQYGYERELVFIYGHAVIGSSGAVSSAQGGGLLSVTKSATAGQYVVTLRDKFAHLMSAIAYTVLATPSGVANVQLLMNPATMQASLASSPALTFQCVDYAGAAVNPASGEQVFFAVVMRRTSVSPYDNTNL